jgi:hypothetical protein
MAIAKDTDRRGIVADKAAMREIIAAQNRAMGFVRVPGATAERAQALILADGVKPEDNVFSRGIVDAREE